jgi:hypothetical protein
MKRRAFATAGTAAFLAAMGLLPAVARADQVGLSAGARGASDVDLRSGQLVGVALTDDGALTLTAEEAAWSEEPYTRAGNCVSPLLPLDAPTAALAAGWEGERPAGAAVRLEVRGWEGERPTPWEEVPTGGGVMTLAWPASAAQCRISLLAIPGAAAPIVRGARVAPAVFGFAWFMVSLYI